MATEQREDGALIAVAGASRFGKTAWVKQQLADAQRLLIFDQRGEYIAADDDLPWPGTEVCRSLPELAERLRDAGTGPLRITYHGRRADFLGWCDLAYLWAQLWPCAIVAEELGNLTNSAKAQGGWHDLTSRSMYYGAHVYGIAQRTQEVDKSLWGNASVMHTHGFILPLDQQCAAGVFNVPEATIAGLQKLQFIERHSGEANIRTGKITFKHNKPA